MKRIIEYSDQSDEEMGESENSQDQPMSDDGLDEFSDSEMQDEEGEHEVDEEDSSDEGSGKLLPKKRSLKERLKEEKDIRSQEARLREGKSQPQDMDDYERMLVANPDQSYLWIQYVSYMLDNIGVEAGRKVVERAIKAVSVSNDQDKLNIWTAYMNLESNFGTQESLAKVTVRALEVNDKRSVYLNLINIYKTNQNLEFVEPIYKQLVKKYSNSVDLWAGYIEFLIEN
jgi:rRNA biogenesis protein RRP5